jgi:hypothetical protein
MMRRRTLAACALGIGCALLGCWLALSTGSKRAAVSQTQAAGGQQPALPPLFARAKTLRADAVAAPPKPSDDIDAAKYEEPRLPLERHASAPSQDDPGPGPYLERYAGRSGRLSPHANPSPKSEPVRNASNAKEPELLVWTESLRVSAGQPGSVRAALVDGSGKPVTPERIDVVALSEQNTPLAPPTAMLPSSTALGEFSSDLATLATTEQQERPAPPREYRYLVRAIGVLGDKPYERQASGFFYAQNAGAKLDPARAAVAFNHGNLELALTFSTDSAGSYFASAELWGGPDADRPIAFARQQLGRLAPGEQKVTLMFGGQVIHDSGIDGPYTVRNVQLLKVDSVPPHAAEPIAALPATQGFASRDFY